MNSSSPKKRIRMETKHDTSENNNHGKEIGKTGTVVLITGASRGFGKALATQCASIDLQKTDYVLISRNAEDLERCKIEIEEIRSKRFQDTSGSEVSVVCADLADLNSLESTLGELFDKIGQKSYGRGILFSNAGDVHPLCPIQEIEGVEAIEAALDFSMTSFMWLASKFLQLFGSSSPEGIEDPLGPPSVLVNVSSRAAHYASSSMAAYCTGKAARQMAMKVVAQEQDPRKLKVLNYGPGPVDTAIQETVRTSETLLKSKREMFLALKDEGKLVNPADSAAKCLEIINDNTFESGFCFDFYW